MNSSSALKFFIRFLPKLVMDGGSCFELLLSLLPEAAPSDPAASSNPLFDEDPLNDFAEDLVVLEHVVQSLEGVVTELTRTKQLSMRHYSSLSKIIPPQTLTQVSGSWWENKHAFLNQKKAQLLSPLLTAIGEAVNCGLEDPTKALHL